MRLKEKIAIIAIFFSAAFFIAPKIVLAQVIFNEVTWMGSSISANDEWMELYNDAATAVDLTGWKIIFLDKNLVEKFTVNFTDKDIVKQISDHGYFLLERTDDDTVPDIVADKIYTGALNNDGGVLKLFDAQNNSIDEINNVEKWLAGDNTKKLTMERGAGGAWQNSTAPNGTPKSANSGGAPTPTPSPSVAPSASPTATSSATPSPTPAPAYQYSKDILINEFLPNPETGDKEWVELINIGSSAINLASWQIDDEENSTSPQVIPADTTISPNEFLVISFNKSTLNNDGDKVRLLWPDDQVVHSVLYAKATPGQAVAKFDAGWLWTNQPTPGQANKKSLTEKNETISLSVAPNSADKITTIEETVAVQTGAPRVATINNQTAIAPAATPTKNNLAADRSAPNPNLIAAANEPIKNNSGSSAILILAGVVSLAALAGGGLVYFRRQKQVDIEEMDD